MPSLILVYSSSALNWRAGVCIPILCVKSKNSILEKSSPGIARDKKLVNRVTANPNKLRKSSVQLNVLRGCKYVQAITRAERRKLIQVKPTRGRCSSRRVKEYEREQ